MEQPSSQVAAVAHNVPCFKSSEVEQIIEKVLIEKLQGKVYNSEESDKWIREIADAVNLDIEKSAEMPGFKHVVHVNLGQQLGGKWHYIGRCFWDVRSDSQATCTFANTSLFCICTVFGAYVYQQQQTQKNTTEPMDKVNN